MAKSDRVRVDYMPGAAAVEALEVAQGLFPNSNAQALIDRLVITGLSALLLRPCEVLSRIANPAILEVAHNAFRVLLQHRHVIVGSLA
jgi:hypothetical protein